MRATTRVLVLILALLMFATVFVGCKKKETPPKEPGKLIGDDSDEKQNPYEGVDFGGRIFKVHINTKDAGFESSSRYIMPVEELDAKCNELEKKVFERDAWMAENLNMDIEYTPYSAEYNAVVESLRVLVNSGASYDLFIDKLFPMANFSLEGHFENVAGRSELQYFENYWYNDYMNSLSLDEGSTMYLLAGDYKVTLTVAQPNPSLAGGKYEGNQTVTITCTTEGAKIYYTIDGSTPTAENGILYTGPITLSKSCILKVIAVMEGRTDSKVVSRTYNITGGGSEENPADTGNGNKPAQTTEPATDDRKGGCGSVIGAEGVVLLAVVSLAGALVRGKRKQDD